MCGCLLHAPYWTWPATQMCALDWDSNQQPSGLQAGTQCTEPHQPGLVSGFFDGKIDVDN